MVRPCSSMSKLEVSKSILIPGSVVPYKGRLSGGSRRAQVDLGWSIPDTTIRFVGDFQ